MRPRRVQMGSTPPAEGSASEEAAPERRRPVVGKALVAAAIVGLGLLALAVTNLYLTLDSEAVGAWVTPRAESALNRPVTLGDAGVSLWPRPAVRLADVRVGNLPGFDGPMLAQVDAVRLDVSWLPLVIGRVHVRRLVLDGARLHLAIDERGTSNFGDLVPRSDPLRASAGPAPVALRIDEISLLDGSLAYLDAPRGRSLVVSGLDAEAALAPDEDGGWRTTVAARSDSLLVRIAGVGGEIVRGAGPTAVLRAHGGAGKTIEIDEGHVAFAEDTLAVYGGFSLGPDPELDLLFTNDRVSAAFLTALFPSEDRSELLPRVEGELGIMVELHGGAGARPSARGSLRLHDVAVRIRGQPLVDGVSGLVALTPDTVVFDSLGGRFAGGPFEVSGTLSRTAGVAAFVARGEPDLDAFDRLGLLPSGTTLSGDASVHLSIVGPASSLDSLEVVGVAAVTGLQLEHERLGVPVYVPSGEVSLLGREARWSDLSALLGQERIVSSGSIADVFDLWPATEEAPRLDISVAAQHIDLNAALPPRDTAFEATYAQLALAHLGGRVVDGRTASVVAAEQGLSRPDHLPVRGVIDLEVDTFVFRRHTLQDVSTRIQLGDSALTVAPASFGAWGGAVSGSLRLDIGPAGGGDFALSLSVDDVEAQPFLSAMSPVGETVAGTLHLDLEVAGLTDASLLPEARELRGRAAVRIADGQVGGTGLNMALADFLGADSWRHVAFEEWVMEMSIQDRVLDIREARLSGDTGEVVFSGPLRLDGSTDLSMGVSIPPERLGEVTLRRTGIGQSVLEQLRAAGGSLELGLRVSGWLQAPTLEPDASNAMALAR